MPFCSSVIRPSAARRSTALICLGVACVFAVGLDAGAVRADEAVAGKAGVVGRAQAYVAGLDAAQRRAGVLPFEHPNRRVWTFLPGRRPGLTLRALRPPQRGAALDMVRSVLSDAGWRKVEGIFTLEEVLYAGLSAAQRRRDPTWRDPLGYTLTVFGRPAAEGTWGFRLGGHHLSLNVTVVDGEARCAPFFFGGSPARVARGPHRGLAPLDDQERTARGLLRSLSDAQRRTAVLSARVPGGIFLGPRRGHGDAKPAGISLMDLSESQIAAFWGIVDTYGGMLAPGPTRRVLERARQSDPKRISFAWMGSAEPGRDHYYRIRGPTFAIEYWKQGNHIHSVWRDSTDFSPR